MDIVPAPRVSNHRNYWFNVFLIINCVSSLLLAPVIEAQDVNDLQLPIPGEMVQPSEPFNPVLLKGMTVNLNDPFQLDFIADSGQTDVSDEEFKTESERLIKYFLVSMTIPKDDLWVNLSPYEADRIIPEALSKTDLGRDLLAQDYILKQLTASLLYPEKELGQTFWDRVYTRAQEEFGTTDIPIDTFNKVWIVPDEVAVIEHNQTVYVTEAKLKVMLEEDYLAAYEASNKNSDHNGKSLQEGQSTEIQSDLIRQLILPEIEHEVNHGKHFAPLRQIFHSLILAKWYKETVKNSILSAIYIDRNRIAGVDTQEEVMKERIYDQYMDAYQKGVYDYIKEDYDRLSRATIPRKYFSGGIPIGEDYSLRSAGSPIGGITKDSKQIKLRLIPKKNNLLKDLLNEDQQHFWEELTDIVNELKTQFKKGSNVHLSYVLGAFNRKRVETLTDRYVFPLDAGFTLESIWEPGGQGVTHVLRAPRREGETAGREMGSIFDGAPDNQGAARMAPYQLSEILDKIEKEQKRPLADIVGKGKTKGHKNHKPTGDGLKISKVIEYENGFQLLFEKITMYPNEGGIATLRIKVNSKRWRIIGFLELNEHQFEQALQAKDQGYKIINQLQKLGQPASSPLSNNFLEDLNPASLNRIAMVMVYQSGLIDESLSNEEKLSLEKHIKKFLGFWKANQSLYISDLERYSKEIEKTSIQIRITFDRLNDILLDAVEEYLNEEEPPPSFELFLEQKFPKSKYLFNVGSEEGAAVNPFYDYLNTVGQQLVPLTEGLIPHVKVHFWQSRRDKAIAVIHQLRDRINQTALKESSNQNQESEEANHSAASPLINRPGATVAENNSGNPEGQVGGD